MAIAVKKALGTEGVLVMQVNGTAAGQTVPHVHFHIIPRKENLPLRVHASEKEDPSKLRKLAERIIAALCDGAPHICL
jgi:histidine triad (HIT) family protein